MDPWKNVSEGKGVWLYKGLENPFDNHGGCKSKVMGSEIRPFFNFESYPLVSNTQALEKLDLMNLGFSDGIRKSYSVSSELSGEILSDDIGTDSYGNVVSPFCEERDLGSRLNSTGIAESNYQDFSLIDLKLGSLADGVGTFADGFSKPSVSVPSMTSSPPAKRARSSVLYPRTQCCQVFGCNKDLSSFKGYYKRHRVCDVHTKTAKVVVDGIEQRFCQQCSRFHLLGEFDDGKRCCRRRLAAHNKRRRKPQLLPNSGTGIIGFSSSYAISEVLPSFMVGSGESMEDKFFDIGTSTIHGFSGTQQASRALSLLSTQSHSTPSHSRGAAINSTVLINKGDHGDTSAGHLLNHSTGTLKRISQSGFHAAGMYSMGADSAGPTTIDLRGSDAVDLISKGPDARNDNHYHQPLERGVVLDLLQLSSRLQRVEQLRHSTESDAG